MANMKNVSLLAAETRRAQAESDAALQAVTQDLYAALAAATALLRADVDQLRQDVDVLQHSEP